MAGYILLVGLNDQTLLRLGREKGSQDLFKWYRESQAANSRW